MSQMSTGSSQITIVIEPRIIVVNCCNHKLRHFQHFHFQIHFTQWAFLPATGSKLWKLAKNVKNYGHMTAGYSK